MKIPEVIMPSEEYLRNAWIQTQKEQREDKNCISYWYPRIQGHVPTPLTIFIPLDLSYEQNEELCKILENIPTLDCD